MGASVRILSREDVKRLSVVQSSSEVIGWKYYDTLVYDPAAPRASYTFFQQSIGQAGVTREVTNLTLPSQLPSGHQMVVEKIVCKAYVDLPTLDITSAMAIWALYRQGSVQFNIGGRVYHECPMADLFGGFLFGFAATGNATEIAYLQGNAVVTGAIEPAITIPSTFNFDLTVTYPVVPVIVVPVKTFLKVYLIGKLIRPRQG